MRRKYEKEPSKGWPRYIRLENEWRAVEEGRVEQKALELKYPLNAAGKVKGNEEEN